MFQRFYVRTANKKDTSYMLMDRDYLCIGIYPMDINGTVKFLIIGEDNMFIFVKPHDVRFTRTYEEIADLPTDITINTSKYHTLPKGKK